VTKNDGAGALGVFGVFDAFGVCAALAEMKNDGAGVFGDLGVCTDLKLGVFAAFGVCAALAATKKDGAGAFGVLGVCADAEGPWPSTAGAMARAERKLRGAAIDLTPNKNLGSKDTVTRDRMHLILPANCTRS